MRNACKNTPVARSKGCARGKLQRGDSDARVRQMAFVREEIKWRGTVEMPFPGGREKVERSDFSRVCLLKVVGVSDEITGQQVQSKKGGPHFSQHHALGLHGSAPLAALPAGAKMGT